MTKAEVRAREILREANARCAEDGGRGGRFPNWTDENVVEVLGPLLAEHAVVIADINRAALSLIGHGGATADFMLAPVDPDKAAAFEAYVLRPLST